MKNTKQSISKGFKITHAAGVEIRFDYYLDDAPATANAFQKILPFKRFFMHARVSGEEIWTDEAPPLQVIQENASVFVMPGEIVYGPESPARVKTSNCIGIYYGSGKGLDAANIFACVKEQDRHLLVELGNKIWLHGKEELTFREI